MANSTHRVPYITGQGAGPLVIRSHKGNHSQFNPEFPFWWSQTITFEDLDDAAQSSTVTVASSGFVQSRVSLAFSGGPLSSTITVTADTVAGDTQDDMAGDLATAIEAEGDLDDIVAATDATNVVTCDFTDGQGLVEITATVTPAELRSVTFGGTPVDGDYSSIISGGGLGSPVTVTTTRTAGTPADVAAMAVQHEADIEALIATTLAGVVQSADDDAVDTNNIQFEPGIAAVTVTTSVPRQTFTVTNAGTPDTGVYSFRVNHSSLPGGSQVVSFDRQGAEDETGIGDGLEADLEANGALMALIASADNAAGVNTITTHVGVTDMTIDNETAPGTGTLVAAETSPTMTVTDNTPAAYDVTVAHTATVDLNAQFPENACYSDVTRSWCGVYVSTVFAAGSSLDLGDAASTTAVLDGVVLTSEGWVGDTGTTEADDMHENAWTPLVTFTLGATLPTAGECDVYCRLRCHETGTWA